MDATTKSKADDIRHNPHRHRHEYDALVRCCMVNGVLDVHLMELHSKHAPLGTNGGVACDVTSGPCACGAWH